MKLTKVEQEHAKHTCTGSIFHLITACIRLPLPGLQTILRMETPGVLGFFTICVTSHYTISSAMFRIFKFVSQQMKRQRESDYLRTDWNSYLLRGLQPAPAYWQTVWLEFGWKEIAELQELHLVGIVLLSCTKKTKTFVIDVDDLYDNNKQKQTANEARNDHDQTPHSQ